MNIKIINMTGHLSQTNEKYKHRRMSKEEHHHLEMKNLHYQSHVVNHKF